MTGRRVPVSRRDRPAKPALSREGIVAAAVAILRAEGLERVTMRRLATALDTGPASLYVYLRDTRELHAAVLDELLGGVDLGPADASGSRATWRERLVNVLRSYVGVLYDHPSLARVALVTRPSGENYLALVERLLRLLAESGVPPERAAWAVDVLLLVATATGAEQGTRAVNPDAGAEDDALVEALAQASPARYPHIAALAGPLVGGAPEDRLRWQFEVLVNGILATQRPDDG